MFCHVVIPQAVNQLWVRQISFLNKKDLLKEALNKWGQYSVGSTNRTQPRVDCVEGFVPSGVRVPHMMGFIVYIGERKEGFLFQTRDGNMLSPESFYRNGLAMVLKQMGRTHVRFNAFRRFRESVLLRSECRQILIDYWMGHENPGMSARYG